LLSTSSQSSSSAGDDVYQLHAACGEHGIFDALIRKHGDLLPGQQIKSANANAPKQRSISPIKISGSVRAKAPLVFPTTPGPRGCNGGGCITEKLFVVR
jgi:hypothetical protein